MPGQEVVSSYSSQLMLGCPSSIWGTRIEIVTVLCSTLASSTDLKEFKLHTVYPVVSEEIQLLKFVGQIPSKGKVSAPAVHDSDCWLCQVVWRAVIWSLLPKAKREFKGLSAKWMTELLEPMLAMQLHSLVGRTGKRKSKELPPSQWQSLLAATGYRKKCSHSCYTESARESKWFKRVLSFVLKQQYFVGENELSSNFARTYHRKQQHTLFASNYISIFQ